MLPVGLRAEPKADALRARKMPLISRPLGYHGPHFFSIKAGKDYMKFDLGRVCATPGTLEAIEAAGQEPSFFLDRHTTDDWREVSAEASHSARRAS